MADANYTPGTWVGVIRSGTAVLLGPGTSPALAGSLWELLGQTPEVHEVLHAVTSGFGSLAEIPWFGIVDSRDSLRVFLRGDLDLSVQLPAGPVHLNGRDVTTWTERRLNDPEWYRLTVAGSEAEAMARAGAGAGAGADAGQPGPVLPLAEGVVLLQSLTVELGANLAAHTETAKPAAMGNEPHLLLAADPAPAAGPAPENARQPAVGLAPDVGIVPAAAQEPDSVPAAELKSETVSGLGTEPETVQQAEPDSVPPPASPQPESNEVSVETVMGIVDDDSAFAVEAPDPVHHGSPAPFPDQVPAQELTGSYDHLWEKTVVRRIEDAAVRDQPEADEHQGMDSGAGVPAQADVGLAEPGLAEPGAAEPGPAEPGAPKPAAAEPVAAPAGESGNAAGSLSGTQPAAPSGPLQASPMPAKAAPVPAAKPAPGVNGGLIDSVPWRTGGSSTPAAEAKLSVNFVTAPNFVPAPAAGHGTAASTGAPAPAPAQAQPQMSGPLPGPAGPPPAPMPAVQDGFDADHDGETIMKSELNLKGDSAAAAAGAAAGAGEPDAAVGPLVLARVCDRGHANPPTHAQCAVCASSLPADAVQVARPRLGRMRVSTGELVDLDQSLVIGRQPSVSRVQGGGMPRLVQVASPSGDISRSHVEVRLEGWHVMLCDLKATNGTVLVRDGQQPRRLAQNEMAILLDGDIAELGDDISLRFEEIL